MGASLAKFFQNFVLKNLSLKIVALAVAVLLWWAVGHDQTVEVPLSVPVEFQHTPSDLEINSDYPFQARITLRGPQRLLEAMNPSEVHAVLDLQGAGPGQRTFDLTPKQVSTPRNVNVVQIVPSQFRISFDRSARRSVPVQPRVIGVLLSGYEITNVATSPTHIMIAGPRRRINAIDTAITDPVDVTGVVGKATFTTHAYVADPLVQVQTPEPIHVTVTTAETPKTPKTSKKAGRH
jgi:YbbR domain-containing protein